jgi:hypothetical protein
MPGTTIETASGTPTVGSDKRLLVGGGRVENSKFDMQNSKSPRVSGIPNS